MTPILFTASLINERLVKLLLGYRADSIEQQSAYYKGIERGNDTVYPLMNNDVINVEHISKQLDLCRPNENQSQNTKDKLIGIVRSSVSQYQIDREFTSNIEREV